MSRNKDNALQCKKDLKWFRSRIDDFNNHVPYEVDALSTFKSNIRKQYRLENFNAVRQERVSAERTIRNLKQLLSDIDELRKQVTDRDLDKFDKLVSNSQERISSALNSFNEYYQSLSLDRDNGRCLRTSDETMLSNEAIRHEERQMQIMLHIDEDRWNVQSLLERSREMEKIEGEIVMVNEIFRDLATMVQDQAPTVDNIEKAVEESHEHVVSAQGELAQVAAKMNGAAYPVLGAVIGTIIGGPVGFIAGLKVGTIMGVTGSVIGFSGGKVLKNRQQKTQKMIMERHVEKETVS